MAKFFGGMLVATVFVAASLYAYVRDQMEGLI